MTQERFLVMMILTTLATTAEHRRTFRQMKILPFTYYNKLAQQKV